MPDPLVLAGLLLVLAPLVGSVPVWYPPLIAAWTATREDHIALVGAHRRAWRLANAGFGLATIGTASGLATLAAALLPDDRRPAAAVAALAVAYAMAGVPWLAVLAIRSRTTPALDDLGATAAPADHAEILLGAATGGLFAAFVLATGPVLVLLSVVLAASGIVAVPIAIVAALIAAIGTGSQLVNGDTIPAVLYPPTMLLGVALLAGWT